MSKYNEEFKLKVVQLHNAGRYVSDLANKFDIRRSTIYAWVKKYNSHDNNKLLTKTFIVLNIQSMICVVCQVFHEATIIN